VDPALPVLPGLRVTLDPLGLQVDPDLLALRDLPVEVEEVTGLYLDRIFILLI
jgi:hypothetical protein